MKYIKLIILSGFVGFALWSCSDEEVGPVFHQNGGLAIISPVEGDSWVLNDTLPDLTVTWSEADYGYEAGIIYSLEVDIAGNNFASPSVLGNVNNDSIPVDQDELNNIMLAKELEPNVASDVEFRVISKVGGSYASDTSAAVKIAVTPYPSNVVIPQLQVPGSYQGWSPADSTTAVYSPANNGQYEGFVHINIDDAKYKYTVGPSWDTNYGDTDDNGSLDQNGTDISAGAAGVYKLNANLNQLTHTRLRTDWGLIGSATPGQWDSDQDMTYDPATKKFTITLDLTAGDIKFRANDNWDFNLGDTGGNKTCEYNGDNIVVSEAGNYTIELAIVGVPKYRYTIKKN